MKIAAQIVIILLLMAVSFIFGSRIGVETYLASDAKFKAALLSIYLEHIENGRIDGLKRALDSDLDLELYLHKKSENNPFIYLFPEMNVGSENQANAESALVKAATYRKNHPSNFPSKAVIESSNLEDKQYYQEFSDSINEVITKYAK